MSQFDLPRINFHGTALLDTATANNGNYEPSLTMFDQEESKPYLPPRCYLANPNTYQPPSGVEILIDNCGKSYVPIKAIDSDNYQQWATTSLGRFKDDELYWTLYENLGLTGANPGYWNYFGDLSMSLVDTQVTGVTLENSKGGVVTYTPENQEGCPAYYASMLGAELSFNNNYFQSGSRTTAYLCDVDSKGQMCTQIFCGQAGLYSKDAQGNPVTFFNGQPVKSTGRWMNLNKVLNYSDRSIIPMGGSACFYSMVELDESSELSKMMSAQTGKTVNGVCIKLLIHQVYEVRNPDYATLPTKSIYDLNGNQSGVPKNPAMVAVSGSITPWNEGDLKTASVCRLMKNNTALNLDTSNIPAPVTKDNTTLSVASSVNLGPIQFNYDQNSNLLSLDVINFVNEYGSNPAPLASYAGAKDIPAFQTFESYNFGTFTVMYQPDAGGSAQTIGTFDFIKDYNMSQLLATGGVIDFQVSPATDYSQGYFYLTLNDTTVTTEDNYLITSDQMGNYAQQNQSDNNYMSDGLPKIPCTLNVYYRGVPVSQNNPLSVTMQAINMISGSIANTPNYPVYNGMTLSFQVNVDGCMNYAFIDSQSQLFVGGLPNLIFYAMNTSIIVVRTLEDSLALDKYLNGNTPITWDVVYSNVFELFKVLYPVMNAILPFTEANWSNPTILRTMLMMIDDSNWNQPLYMPVTRDLSAQQMQLLTMWANQIINPKPTV